MLILEEVRCPDCGRKLGNINGQAQIKCSKCKALVHIDTTARTISTEERSAWHTR